MIRPRHARIVLLLSFALGLGCTRLKPVPTPSDTPTPVPSATPSGTGASTVPSSTPSVVVPSPTPSPLALPTITLLGPSNGQDFGANAIDIAFAATAATGHKIVSASVLYNGTLLTTIKGEGPAFKLSNWNPNVVNNLSDKPDMTVVPNGDKTLTILATDETGGVGKLEFGFRKPLRIVSWAEMTSMPGATSHFAVFGDGAQPPSFTTLWGSVDGIESTVFPRTENYAFNPVGVGAWSTIKINGSSVPRAGYGWTLHPSGQLVYIVGGRTGTQDLRTLDVYSPLRKVAEQSLSVMTNARRDAAVVYSSDNFLYAIGGKAADTPIYSVERVAIGTDGNATGDWKAMSDTQSARSGATAIQQGKEIWLFGGGFRPIEVYDPDTNKWRFLTQPDGTVVGTPETWANSLMVTVGDRLFFFGGQKEDGSPVSSIYEFTPAARSWRTVGPLPTSNLIPAAEIGTTRLGGFFLGDSFYLLGGMSLPAHQVTKRVFKGTTL